MIIHAISLGMVRAGGSVDGACRGQILPALSHPARQDNLSYLSMLQVSLNPKLAFEEDWKDDA